MTRYFVYYMKPEFFRDGLCGALPDTSSAASLARTHTFLKTLDVAGEPSEAALGAIYDAMQAESWSPNGEARLLIAECGLEHTSMSVGDVIELPCPGHSQNIGASQVWVVAGIGFKKLNGEG